MDAGNKEWESVLSRYTVRANIVIMSSTGACIGWLVDKSRVNLWRFMSHCVTSHMQSKRSKSKFTAMCFESWPKSRLVSRFTIWALLVIIDDKKVMVTNDFWFTEGAAANKKKTPKASPKTATPTTTQETKTSTSTTKTAEKESVSRSSTPSNEKSLKHKLG